MLLRILGTGNAQAVNCYNTCFILEDENRDRSDRYFLVDTGGGNQILKKIEDSGIDLNDIHDIFITHEHIDHLLGIIWIIRMTGTAMNKEKYDGDLRIYCHENLVNTIKTIAGLTIQKKITKYIGSRILFIPVRDGESRVITGNTVTFFDIHSTKAEQYGFTMDINDIHTKLTCCGDEPYNEADERYVSGSDWLLHEAFCMYADREKFDPYTKSHTTVKEACETAQRLGVPNLVLYHTEDKNLANRKEQYTLEGKNYYKGNLLVPDDMEIIHIK